MRHSMYLDSYLDGNTQRGNGNGWTISTFLGKTLTGKAGKYSGRYAVALWNACHWAVDQGIAVKGKSRLGGVAYYRKEQA